MTKASLLVATAAAMAVLAACGGDNGSTKLPAAFVGQVPGSDFYLGINVKDERELLAYVCDGSSTGEWFKGEVDGADVNLTSPSGARLRASLSPHSASGTVTVAGKQLKFKALPAVGEAGVYRAERDRSGNKEVTGWIVLANSAWARPRLSRQPSEQ